MVFLPSLSFFISSQNTRLKLLSFLIFLFNLCLPLKISFHSLFMLWGNFFTHSLFFLCILILQSTHTQEFTSRLSVLSSDQGAFFLWRVKVGTGSLLVITLVRLSGQESLSFLEVHRWTLFLVTLYP